MNTIPPVAATTIRLLNSTTQLRLNKPEVPLGTTVVLVCSEREIHYNWTCPHPPCDGEYRKVYNNLLLIVATPTTSGQYKCTPSPNGNQVSASLTMQTSLNIQGK